MGLGSPRLDEGVAETSLHLPSVHFCTAREQARPRPLLWSGEDRDDVERRN